MHRRADGLADGWLWTDGECKTLHTVTPITDELSSIIDEHVGAQARLPADLIHGGPELSYDSIGVDPVAIAFLHFAGVANRPTILIALLDLPRLKKDLVDPLIPTSGDLEVVRVGSTERSARKPWSQRMFSAMRFWEIHPSERFLREQSRTVTLRRSQSGTLEVGGHTIATHQPGDAGRQRTVVGYLGENIDIREVLGQALLVALDQASGNDDTLELPGTLAIQQVADRDAHQLLMG